MIDICLNLASEQFKTDRDLILKRGLEHGCTGFILTGTSESSSLFVHGITKSNPEFTRSTAGVHPHEAKNWNLAKNTIKRLVHENEVVAVGECGLDYDRMYSTKEDQLKAFKEQLDLSLETGKPAFLHIRGHQGDEIEVMKDFSEIYKPYYHKGVKGVVHCFTGSQSMLKQLLEFDLYIGITGWVCDNKRGKDLQEAISLIPDNRIMIETDAPYLTPKNMPKKIFTRRNEPAYLGYVRSKVAELKGISEEKLELITNNNVENLFKWLP